MKQKITPFLWFDRNSEEAINFYISVFNGSPVKGKPSKIVSIQRYPDGPLEGPMKGFEGQVLTAIFELNGQEFMALDGGPIFKFTEAVSFYVQCESQEEVDYFWEVLTKGTDPASQQCGWLKDKFGLSWQIIPKEMDQYVSGSDPVKAKRAVDAMLQMKKIDLAKIKEAYEGK